MKKMGFRIYCNRRSHHIGVVTRSFCLTAFPTLAWLRPGWWFWERVAGTFIMRFGPFVLTVWKAVR